MENEIATQEFLDFVIIPAPQEEDLAKKRIVPGDFFYFISKVILIKKILEGGLLSFLPELEENEDPTIYSEFQFQIYLEKKFYLLVNFDPKDEPPIEYLRFLMDGHFLMYTTGLDIQQIAHNCLILSKKDTQVLNSLNLHELPNLLSLLNRTHSTENNEGRLKKKIAVSTRKFYKKRRYLKYISQQERERAVPNLIFAEVFRNYLNTKYRILPISKIFRLAEELAQNRDIPAYMRKVLSKYRKEN